MLNNWRQSYGAYAAVVLELITFIIIFFTKIFHEKKIFYLFFVTKKKNIVAE